MRLAIAAAVIAALGMVPNFAIVARPVHFAAGDDVITESIEQAGPITKRYDN